MIGGYAAHRVSKRVRAGKERKIQQALSDCLAEHGYAVTAWRPVGKWNPAPAAAKP